MGNGENFSVFYTARSGNYPQGDAEERKNTEDSNERTRNYGWQKLRMSEGLERVIKDSRMFSAFIARITCKYSHTSRLLYRDSAGGMTDLYIIEMISS